MNCPTNEICRWSSSTILCCFFYNHLIEPYRWMVMFSALLKQLTQSVIYDFHYSHCIVFTSTNKYFIGINRRIISLQNYFFKKINVWPLSLRNFSSAFFTIHVKKTTHGERERNGNKAIKIEQNESIFLFKLSCTLCEGNKKSVIEIHEQN